MCVPILHMHTRRRGRAGSRGENAPCSLSTFEDIERHSCAVHPLRKTGAVVGRGRFLHLDEEASFKCPSSRIPKPGRPKRPYFSSATLNRKTSRRRLTFLSARSHAGITSGKARRASRSGGRSITAKNP